MNKAYEVVVVGGGPAGLAAALSAKENGAETVLLLERNQDLGGILNQCIHNGFGLHFFGEELTGPEYAERFIARLDGSGVEVLCGSMVLDVTAEKTVHYVNPKQGYCVVSAKAVILAMGSRERSRGAVGIPGARPAGVFTAGAAQLYVNIEGQMVGKKVVILGSGDIGLIMARRLTLEGAKVLGVYELQPHSGGLMRNIVQCLDDFGIPLYLSHTITEIKGDRRVEGVVVQKVDESLSPIAGSEEYVECDTVLLSVGLIPENELSRNAGVAIDPRTRGPLVYENMQTNIPGIFACGNVAHIHDLVDFVTVESVSAGKSAAEYCKNCETAGAELLHIKAGDGLGYALPQMLRPSNVTKSIDIFFRVRRAFKNVSVLVTAGGEPIARFKREAMLPGEMDKITLSKAILDRANKNDIEISIKQTEA